jgi:hypothetical protein
MTAKNQVERPNTTNRQKRQSLKAGRPVGKSPHKAAATPEESSSPKGWLCVRQKSSGRLTPLCSIDSRVMDRLLPSDESLQHFIESALTERLDSSKASDAVWAAFFQKSNAMSEVISQTAGILELLSQRLMQLEVERGRSIAGDTVSGFEFLATSTAQTLRDCYNAVHDSAFALRKPSN